MKELFMLRRKKSLPVSLKRQHGYLILLVVVLIVVIGFLSVVITNMFVGGATNTVNALLSTQALYLADSGLEQGTHLLLTPKLTNRMTCSGLTINNSLGAGEYNVTATGPFYNSSPATLTSNITATATTIPASSTSGYRSFGRIMIDHELINYTSIVGNNFTGVSRGADSSVAAIHTAGARIGQFQCNLSSQGGVPSLNPSSTTIGGSRNLVEAIQLEEGWAVGNNLSGSVWSVVHGNFPVENQWTQTGISAGSAQTLTAVSSLSNADAWIVGNKASVFRYNGSTWTLTNTGISGGDNLTSVSAVSSQEVWTCADQGKIYRWSPTTNWVLSSSPGNNPNGISMVDSNGDGIASTGWVVGAKKSATRYNGTNWSSSNSGISVDLSSVSTLSATEAWAAGNNGKTFRWGGSSWSEVANPTGNTLNSISMIKFGNTTVGWAVGNNSTAIFYNGTTWTLMTTGLASGLTLKSVVTLSDKEAWLTDSSGHIYGWDGTSWILAFTTSNSLNGIDINHPNSQPFSGTTENFS